MGLPCAGARRSVHLVRVRVRVRVTVCRREEERASSECEHRRHKLERYPKAGEPRDPAREQAQCS